jgi:hypothetical protein
VAAPSLMPLTPLFSPTRSRALPSDPMLAGAAHRSTLRYTRHIKGIFMSRTLKALMAPLTYFGLVAVAAGVYSSWVAPAYSLPKVLGFTEGCFGCCACNDLGLVA